MGQSRCKCKSLPETSVLIQHFADSAVIAGLSKASVHSELAAVAMEIVCTLAREILVTDLVTGCPVGARVFEAGIAFRQHVLIRFVYEWKSNRQLETLTWRFASPSEN